MVVPSVATIASARPAAATCCAPRASLSPVVTPLPGNADALPERRALSSLPTFESLLTALAAPRPGTTNCVMTSAPLPTTPSGSIPAASLNLLAAFVMEEA